jgi:hypothetical protein
VLVAGEQDPLAFLACEAVSYVAVAAFAAVDTITDTSKLTAPSLQRGEANTQQSSHHSGQSTGHHGSIEDLNGLAGILRCGQSPSSSPQ